METHIKVFEQPYFNRTAEELVRKVMQNEKNYKKYDIICNVPCHRACSAVFDRADPSNRKYALPHAYPRYTLRSNMRLAVRRRCGICYASFALIDLRRASDVSHGDRNGF